MIDNEVDKVNNSAVGENVYDFMDFVERDATDKKL